MPSASSHVILGGLSVFQIQKFIPKIWKQTTKLIREKFPVEDESMIDNLIKCLKEFVSQNRLSKAFETFSHIQLHGSSSTSHDLLLDPISSLLLSCINIKALQPGKQLHTKTISLGLEQHPVLVPKLITFYSTFNLLDEVQTVTENTNSLHPLPWNMLISLYVRNGLFTEALATYKQMATKGIRPDSFTYPSVLKACGESLDLAFGTALHESIKTNHHEWNLYVHNALISMYGKFGKMDVARQLFDKMPERDAVSWNTMISCYASKGMWGEAFHLFEKMKTAGTEVSFITWNTIAGGCLNTGNYRGALELLSQMATCDTHLDSVAMIIGLGACAHIGAIKLGKEIHAFAIRSYHERSNNVRNALITMYSRCNDHKSAHIVFKLTEAMTIITWNSMLSGYTRMDLLAEASFLFREMLLSGIKPNYVTIASILPLCARVANLQHGKEFHCYILRHQEFQDYLLLWNALIDMYARSGKVITAKRVFDLMTKRDEVTYTSLIAGYGIQGEGRIALDLFDEMIKLQIKPDHVTMVAVLSACSHSGLVDEGKMLFEKMQCIYGIIPQLEHFACMADLYGRAGLLSRAKEVIRKMPYKPTPAMWATLLGACCIHRNTDIGEWAAENLLATKPEHSGYYVLIANMYAAAGCWSKLAKVRTFMRDLGMRKAPGCAWVDGGSGFSPFLVGDTSNFHAHEIYPLLDGLNELMKSDDYVSEFGSDDEVLEEIV